MLLDEVEEDWELKSVEIEASKRFDLVVLEVLHSGHSKQGKRPSEENENCLNVVKKKLRLIETIPHLKEKTDELWYTLADQQSPTL